jgi:hypothetical protein
MEQFNENSRPFQKQVFRYTIIAFVIVLLGVNALVYFSGAAGMTNAVKSSLKIIAGNIAENVSYSTHEDIISNDQRESRKYLEIKEYFQHVMDGNPRINDIYTLRPTSNPDIMTFVVSGQETFDANNDNFIDVTEISPEVGEEYDVTGLEDLKNGLNGPSVDRSFTTDKWGRWISGYAPILNDDGVTVALLGVDEAASELVDRKNSLLIALMYIDLILLPLMIFVAIFMARSVSKPFRILAKGMQRVSHGELNYKLPISEKGPQAIFASLFNSMIDMFENAKDHEKKHHDFNE